MRNHLKKITVTIVVYLLWFAAVFDPIGYVFMLRYVALISSLAIIVLFGLYWPLFTHEIAYKKAFIIYISFLMPMYGFTLCLINGGLEYEFRDTSYIAAGLLLLLSLIYADEYFVRVGIRAMKSALRCLTFLIIIIYLSMRIDFNNVNWFSFFTERHVAFLGFRDYAGIQFPYIYLITSPMLVYLIGYDINKLFSKFNVKNVFISFMSILAYAFSGTRAHLIIAIVCLPFCYILLYSKQKLLLSLWFCLVSVVVIYSLYYFQILNSFFSKYEASNAIKFAMIDEYAEIFNNPLTFIFGQGYNAQWSLPLMNMLGDSSVASKTELTYIELFRVYGLVIAIPFYLLLMALIYRLARTSDEYRWLYPALLLYLVDSALNPYLFSTNGMLPLGLILAAVSLKSSPRFDSRKNRRGLLVGNIPRRAS